MKVLVIGSKGSMGKRYCAILKYLGVEYVGVDIGPNSKMDYTQFTHAIIATPTEVHRDNLQWFYTYKNGPKSILCEKPLMKSVRDIETAIDWEALHGGKTNMVCNWKYALPDRKDLEVRYSNYNTGKDGTGWDCIQLIYLVDKLKISTDTPFFKCDYHFPHDTIDSLVVGKVTLGDIENSYITMLRHWLGLDGLENDLWTLTDALKATEKVLTWNKEYE